MSSYRIKRDLNDRLKVLMPFGIGQQKPRHFRDMLRVAWDNRDNLRYAWQVLSKGVCDGCALGVAGFHDWTMPGIHLCMTRLNLLRLNTMPAMDESILRDISTLRGFANAKLRELGRLPFPMLRRHGEIGFTRISWNDALARIGDRIRHVDPNRLAFYLTSRGMTNEVYYVAQKVARFLGTNNIDNAARLCHSPSTGAMKATLGVAASTCSYKDWYGTDLIVFFGSNPANDQPVAMKYLDAAKKMGTKVVMVNPYREPGMQRYWVPSTFKSALFGSEIADWWFPVAQGGDTAFIWGTLKFLIDSDLLNRGFIERHTTGFEQIKQQAEAMPWPQLEQQSGLGRGAMKEFAQLLSSARNAVLVWSMGITQHAFGGDTVQMILNLGLARGYVGRDKCGLMPIRGHSSVQGGAEMGAYATAFPGGKPITEENAQALSAAYGFAIPIAAGLSAAEMVEAGQRKQLEMLWCVGGNFLRTLPDPDYVAQAMSYVPLRVHQDIILTDQMLLDGEEVILLPAKTRYEQDDGGTETTTERRVIFSPEIPRQVGEARAEWKILLDLAAALHPHRAHLLGCESGQAIRDEIARIIPLYDGIQNLRAGGESFQYGGRHLCAGGEFATSDRKAHFRAVPLPHQTRQPDLFKLSTRRGKQFNTLLYSQTDPLTGAMRDDVLMNPDDAAQLHLSERDRIVLVSEIGRMNARVKLAPIAPGNLQVHWPEGNALIARGRLDALGKVPDYNAEVRIEHSR